jgi:hypothetical protein
MQEFWQPWQHLVDRLAKMPIWEVMREDEFARGYDVIVPGDEPWFPAADWHSTSVVSKSLTEVRIIAINAEKRNQGALHRMVDSIVACGLCPVIVGPVSPHMALLGLASGGCRRRRGTMAPANYRRQNRTMGQRPVGVRGARTSPQNLPTSAATRSKRAKHRLATRIDSVNLTWGGSGQGVRFSRA